MFKEEGGRRKDEERGLYSTFFLLPSYFFLL
jgi:hypothetical protein